MTVWFYYMDGGKAVGPLELDGIRARIKERRIGPYQLMLRDGETEWNPALAFPEFRDLLAAVATDAKLSKPWVVLRKPQGHAHPESLGPFSSDEVRAEIKAGHIQYTDYAWKDGMHQWRRIGQLKEFSLEEKPLVTPPPLATPQLATLEKISKHEVLRSVEVVKKVEIVVKAEPIKPAEADGDDLINSALANQTTKTKTGLEPTLKIPEPMIPEVKIPELKIPELKIPIPKLPSDADAKPTLPAGVANLKIVVTSGHDSPPLNAPAAPGENSDAENRWGGERRGSKRSSERERRRKRQHSAEPTIWHKLASMQLVLPANWKQALVVILIVIGAGIKIFAPSSEHVTMEAPPPPPPPISPPVAVAPAPAPPVEAVDTTPPADIPQVSDAETEETQAPRRPATRLKIHISQSNPELAMLSIDTDAPPDQAVWLEVTGGAGMVLDRSHFFRRWSWRSGQSKSFAINGLPAGYYHISAAAGTLKDEDRFEVGTHGKGFSDRLRWSRKHSSYEFWSERKNLYLLAKQLEHHLNSPRKNFQEIDRIGRRNPSSYAFYDLWKELKDICKAAHKPEPNLAKERLQSLQAKITQLSIWR